MTARDAEFPTWQAKSEQHVALLPDYSYTQYNMYLPVLF